ncbi:hypothetical protein CHS0354_000255 [Potamilus streckersoni]|uniref:Heat shock 70 kDa protein 12A n=1 Tax=Potamilus streckersoni TaxID=2493646 RepID=A0AAE0VXP6_9BIVA|nr:hypothetical protein CHS0354_000255 [Potamilus streckersoni]
MALEKGEDSEPCLFYAAIDFGTTHTGYAFIERDKLSSASFIQVDQRWLGGQNINIKAPTACLFNKDKAFVSFGYEAQNHYNQLAFAEKECDWYYFKNFKMLLHHNKKLTTESHVEETNGKTMLALDVFKESIKYIADLVMEKIEEAYGKKVHAERIDWVITVPAIWNDSAKQFMREASVAAGIPNKKLKIALEPEAAAIFCKNQSVIETTDIQVFNPGEKYIVVDMGGGTVDTAVHCVTNQGKLHEEHAAHGGPWGGKRINDLFEKNIEQVVGEKFLRFFKTQHRHEWIQLEDTFEGKKREFLNKEGLITLIPISSKFRESYANTKTKRLHETFENLYHGKFCFDENKDTIVISREKMQDYFDFILNHIKDHIDILLKAVPGVKSILLVGGLADSKVVSNSIKSTYSNLRVIVPKDAAFAILRGALIYRWNSDIILNRISPYTYGVDAMERFNPKRHPKEKIVEVNGRQMVKDTFQKHIVKGQNFSVGEKSKGRHYTLNVHQGVVRVVWNIFRSDSFDPVFCSECDHIGSMYVDIWKKDKPWRFFVTMHCVGTELQTVVKDADTGKELVKCKVDFLVNETELSSDFISE